MSSRKLPETSFSPCGEGVRRRLRRRRGKLFLSWEGSYCDGPTIDEEMAFLSLIFFSCGKSTGRFSFNGFFLSVYTQLRR